MDAECVPTITHSAQREHDDGSGGDPVNQSLHIEVHTMHVAKLQHASEGTFVFDPHDELVTCLAHVLCGDPLDFTSPYLPSEDGMTLEEMLCDPGPSIEDIAVERADMALCVERMNSRQRTVLYNTLAGWSAKDVGTQLNLSVRRVYVARAEAIAIIRNQYRNGHS